MDLPKVPPRQQCGGELELVTRVRAFGDRPATYIFRWQCKQHAPYYRDEDGELRQW